MSETKHKKVPLGALVVAILLALGTLNLILFGQVSIPIPVLPELTDETPEDEVAETSERSEQNLTSMDIRYEQNLSQTAIDEMEDGRFIVDTELPSQPKRSYVFRELQTRGGIIVVRSLSNQYYLLDSSGQRQSLETTPFELTHYALHRPREISLSDIESMGATGNLSGDIPYLVMPKNWEAAILTEIEARLPAPLSEYCRAQMRLQVTSGGHLALYLTQVSHKSDGIQEMDTAIRGI